VNDDKHVADVKAIRDALADLWATLDLNEAGDQVVENALCALDALEAAQKDAERYRWLVAHGGVGFEGAPGWGTVVRFGTADSAANTLTAAIDAAMKDAP
jgi:hypothetical protein